MKHHKSAPKARKTPWTQLALICWLAALPCAYGQDAGAAGMGTDIDALRATEIFRIGLDAYNRYSFNEAILSFEQALSFRPGEGLILDWLGRAYYRSGMESIAMRQWQAAAEAYGSASPEYVLIRSRIETVRARRSLFPAMNDDKRYVETGHFPGVTSDNVVRFSQPSAVLPDDDGSCWVVCYGSNEIIRFDVNGIIRQRERGPLEGFDRPYDMVRGLDGRFYVSEFRGGRISVLSPDGVWQKHIGGKGIKAGQLVGPANMAIDEEGYLYVVEYGNQRISKFDPDGNFIFSFGKRDADFGGILSPTGIAAGKGRVFVADNLAKKIYSFDRNGMYLGILVEEGLNAPESLRFFPDGSLLISDTNRLSLVDIDSTVVKEISRAGNASIRYIGAQTDLNGAIMTANFVANEVTLMVSLDDVASGFFVQIDRIVSDAFPLITVELSVQDSKRRPVLGLDATNFYISEAGRPAADQQFLGSLSSGGRSCDISVLIERSPQAQALKNEISAALRDISQAVDGNIFSIISAGSAPLRERFNAASATSLDAAARGNGGSTEAREDAWRFDLGLRLAATDLLPLSKKRAVVFVTSGELGPLAFEQYSLSELAAYLANNGVVFYAILVGKAPASDDIMYLCNETGGKAVPLYRPQGIAPVLQELAKKPSSSSILSYTSSLNTDFGKAFLPIEAEVYLLERSGRDAAGYFAPLQ